jgi:hypothetical protein
MGKDAIRYIFLLSALLIAVAYFAGLSTDANAFGANAVNIIYAVTGRDKKGAFAAYPKGAPTKIQTF